MATEFEKQGWTKFTPHYLVWVCPDSYHKSDECRSQCIRQGRYCTPDPDGDIAKGYSGKDIVQARSQRPGQGRCVSCEGLASIRSQGLHSASSWARLCKVLSDRFSTAFAHGWRVVSANSSGGFLCHGRSASWTRPDCHPVAGQENLRQLCVFKLANDTSKPWYWWDYVTKFGEECSMVDKTYDEDCAEKVRGSAPPTVAPWSSFPVMAQSSCCVHAAYRSAVPVRNPDARVRSSP